MIQFSKEIADGFIITVGQLERIFDLVNEGDFRWEVSEKRTPIGGMMYAEIGFSNPPVPNTISFLFPVISDPGDPKAAEICLHPEAASIGQSALYVKAEMLEKDGLRDWSTFWSALSFMVERPLSIGAAHRAVLNKASADHVDFLVASDKLDDYIGELINRKRQVINAITRGLENPDGDV